MIFRLYACAISVAWMIYLMLGTVIIYYDYEPAIGVNATCLDWPQRNEYFRTWGEFSAYCSIEYGTSFRLVEITAENYPVLCAEGIFNV